MGLLICLSDITSQIQSPGFRKWRKHGQGLNYQLITEILNFTSRVTKMELLILSSPFPSHKILLVCKKWILIGKFLSKKITSMLSGGDTKGFKGTSEFSSSSQIILLLHLIPKEGKNSIWHFDGFFIILWSTSPGSTFRFLFCFQSFLLLPEEIY